MIIGLPKLIGTTRGSIHSVNILDTLEKMNQSPIEFYLTGSYFFNNEKPKSDIDFFTNDPQEDSDETVSFLRSLGFEEKAPQEGDSYIAQMTYDFQIHPEEIHKMQLRVNNNLHIDPLVTKCFKKADILNINGNRIEIMLVKNIKLRKLLQEIMSKSNVFKNMEKPQRTHLWIYTYMLLDGLNNLNEKAKEES